ncbi:MAG: cis-3-alkyl-4-acyloxetan-2-one decarboxylase [Gaiellaceae bacterium]|nr:cis-3-alkyl-4-acyloxetan-2-one decarboxylase [Gaiellaceae bacterium]
MTASGSLELRAGLHVVDEGAGEPVVLVHGNPTSSHLYRRFVPALAAAGYRAIAPDHLGFGRSPKGGGDLSLPAHAQRFAALMEELALDDVTLVLHDWGGPIALDWALANPERVKRLVFFNTVAWALRARRPPRAYAILSAPLLGELLVKRAHAVVRWGLLRRLPQRPIDDPGPYLAAHPRPADRASILALIRAVPESLREGPARDLLERVGAGLPSLAGKPVLIAWGMRDPILTPRVLRGFRERFPHAEVHELEEAGHFLQEDAHERLVPLLVDWLRRTP